MMGLPVPFVFSHDSIGIGRNGPTHQPVEYLASLRAIPNMLVLRPADAVEAAESWEIALEYRTGPSSLIFSRQPLEPVLKDGGGENLSRRGAYVLAEAEGGVRQATIFATGSEVSIALKARRQLQREGIATAVVSMPSWELFEGQDEAIATRLRFGGRSGSPWRPLFAWDGTAISVRTVALSESALLAHREPRRRVGTLRHHARSGPGRSQKAALTPVSRLFS